MLDVELIVGAGRLSDFYRLSGRLAGKPRAGSEAVAFVAFDLLWLDGEQLTTRPYRDRRARLDGLAVDPVQVVPSYDAAVADDLPAACGEQGMEGVVLKRAASAYRPGRRSGDWRKVKCAGWREHLERRLQKRSHGQGPPAQAVAWEWFSPEDELPEPVVDLLAVLLNRPAWRRDALCVEHPEVNFFTERGRATSRRRPSAPPASSGVSASRTPSSTTSGTASGGCRPGRRLAPRQAHEAA